MAELATNRVWDAGPKDCPSQYARMIPGTSAGAISSVSVTTSPIGDSVAPSGVIGANFNAAARRVQTLTPIQQLLPAIDSSSFSWCRPI